MLTSFDLFVWEINKLYPIHLYGILVINTRPRVITRIPYEWMGYNLFFPHKQIKAC